MRGEYAEEKGLTEESTIEERLAALEGARIGVTGAGSFVEVQGTAEGVPFDRVELDELLDLALGGIVRLTELQRDALGSER